MMKHFMMMIIKAIKNDACVTINLTKMLYTTRKIILLLMKHLFYKYKEILYVSPIDMIKNLTVYN